jgi:hypothetical protein
LLERIVGLAAAPVTRDGQKETRSDAAARGKSLILLDGDKVTPITLLDSLL